MNNVINMIDDVKRNLLIYDGIRLKYANIYIPCVVHVRWPVQNATYVLHTDCMLKTNTPYCRLLQ